MRQLQYELQSRWDSLFVKRPKQTWGASDDFFVCSLGLISLLFAFRVTCFPNFDVVSSLLFYLFPLVCFLVMNFEVRP